MTWRDDAGAIVVSIALLPLLVLVVVSVIELGALRVAATRARHAADLAVLVAINDQDDRELASSGVLVPASDAEDVARSYFALNLVPLGPLLARDAVAIASASRVRISAGPPAQARLEADVPFRTPLLGALLGTAVTTIYVRTAAAAR